MAVLKNNVLFFTTSPRTPSKMIPEIQLLHEEFEGKTWNYNTQEVFMDKLASSNFFEGNGSPSDKAFSARDRINRAPKALGFIDLKPSIALTEAGEALVYGNRPQEVFLRQLLKYQLPSPYHTENDDTIDLFFVRPYLEILRLVCVLDYITFDELKIFGLQLTDYRNFDVIKDKILSFRKEKDRNKGKYRKFVNETWTAVIEELYSDIIASGKTKTRETKDASLKKFIATKKSNMRDYTDACFRYLRYTGLISISHKNKSISVFDDKKVEVDFILANVDRNPVFVDDEVKYKKHLFSKKEPVLYTDNKENIIDIIMRIGSLTKRELVGKELEELKDLRDEIIMKHKEAIIHEQVTEIKSYALYSEIIDTFNEIISDKYYDAPLMFEYNTWRAMTMLDGGEIKGNFKFDDSGQPLSTAQGNMPDIECYYKDFSMSVEVTMQSGQRQYETEGEPVARHYGQLKKRSGKDTFCLFIAPNINPAVIAHFFTLNRTNIAYYGGKSKIVPMELDLFMKLVENSYNYKTQPKSSDIRNLLDMIINKVNSSEDETEWYNYIQSCTSRWLLCS